MAYQVIVRDCNSWSRSTGVHAEIRNCGHKHLSLKAAHKCHARLTAWWCLCGATTRKACSHCHTPHNSTSAAWYHAQVESLDRPGVILDDPAW
jgi:hypothetical protein